MVVSWSDSNTRIFKEVHINILKNVFEEISKDIIIEPYFLHYFRSTMHPELLETTIYPPLTNALDEEGRYQLV